MQAFSKWGPQASSSSTWEMQILGPCPALLAQEPWVRLAVHSPQNAAAAQVASHFSKERFLPACYLLLPGPATLLGEAPGFANLLGEGPAQGDRGHWPKGGPPRRPLTQW